MNGYRFLIVAILLVVGIVAAAALNRGSGKEGGDTAQAQRRTPGRLIPHDGSWTVGGPMRYEQKASYVGIVKGKRGFEAVRISFPAQVEGFILTRQKPGGPLERRYVSGIGAKLQPGVKLEDRDLKSLGGLSARARISPIASAASCAAATKRIRAAKAPLQLDLVSGDIGPVGHSMFCAQLADRG